MEDKQRNNSKVKTKRTATKRFVRTTGKKDMPKKSIAKMVEPKAQTQKLKMTVASKKGDQGLIVNSVKLPTNMSLRSIEKSAVLKREFDYFYQGAMHQIAYVSGLCFLLVGIAYISFGNADVTQRQNAEAISSIIVAEDNISPVPPSEFKFLSSIPTNVLEATQISFEATYAEEVVVTITPIGQFNGYSTTLRKVSENRYTVIIPGPDKIQAGYYNLRVLVRALNGDKYTRKSPDFFMGNKDVEAWYNKSADTSTETVKKDEESTTGTSNDEIIDTSTSPKPTSTTDSVVPATNSPSESETKPETTQEETKDDNIISEEKSLILQLKSPQDTILSGLTKLTLETSHSLQFVELYTRRTTATTPTFVTLGNFRLDRWVFQFDSTNLPNGEYVFFAKTKVNSSSIVSPSLTLKIINENLVITPDVSTVIPDDERELITTDDLPTDDTSATIEDVASETTTLILENKAEINTLLERYAAARAVGDDSLINAAKEAIIDERERIALRTATNARTRNISDSVNSTLEQKLNDLQDRIDTFETLRKQRSAGATATDTDGDGISDIDEVTLYKTDPHNVDSDGDGFVDGVEIVRGYNPIDATPEAVVAFESPKETVGLTRDDVLTVDVVPVPIVNSDPTEITVSTEIRGKSLPHSYVTLYIYSNPTVVTVRTDADGTFIYTFDKELEDGRHDVYVAITDNAGEIIAQSNPFSFIKEAQAFTPIAATEADIVSPVTVTTDTEQRGYSTTIGVSILTFGLVLFMLGISLRRKDEEIIITENTSQSDTSSKL